MSFKTVFFTIGTDQDTADLDRVAAVCGELSAHLTVLVLGVAAPPPASPYLGLDPRAYWRSGVAERDPLDPGDIYRPRFSVTRNMRIEKEEIFGPVLVVETYQTVDEAIELANDSIYGLAAAVWTSSLSSAHRVSRALRAGTVWVNCYDEGGDMNLPFGGFRQSGNGRDKSLHALDKYTELKTTLIKP